MKISRLSLLAVVPFTACEPPDAHGHARDPAPVHRKAWSPDDKPSLLDGDFEYVLDDLPTAGSAARIPWPGPYWPTWRDSINHRWQGPGIPSPAEKYGLAFAVPGVEDAVSLAFGVDSVSGEPCDGDADCDLARGFRCGKRRGEPSGTCIETWFGLCHAWAPAAVLEPEPTTPVTHNGVTFEVNDLKALMTLAYTGDLEVRFVSLRCDDHGIDADDAPACEDTNAGTFHVVVANLLGLRHEAFVEDLHYDYQVWNQPVYAFDVTEHEPLTGHEANQLLAAGPIVYTATKHGSVGAGVMKQLDVVPVAPGQTVRARLSGTGDLDLYVRWNAAPTTSAYHCRPKLPVNDELCELVAPPSATSAHVAVHAAAAGQYDATIEVRDPPPETYAFNSKAKALRRVRTELSWIAESPTSVDGSLSGDPQYQHTSVYDYVLELDAGGKIIGGEWLGGSKIAHPDFLWRPIAKHPGTVAGGKVAWSDVQLLLAGAGAGGDVLLHHQDTIPGGYWHHFAPITLGPSEHAEALLTIADGDADLYVREGARPTLSAYDCRPYIDGDAPESCPLSGPGSFHVSVLGWAPSTAYTLTVTKK